jgi:hypothetical protein
MLKSLGTKLYLCAQWNPAERWWELQRLQMKQFMEQRGLQRQVDQGAQHLPTSKYMLTTLSQTTAGTTRMALLLWVPSYFWNFEPQLLGMEVNSALSKTLD